MGPPRLNDGYEGRQARDEGSSYRAVTSYLSMTPAADRRQPGNIGLFWLRPGPPGIDSRHPRAKPAKPRHTGLSRLCAIDDWPLSIGSFVTVAL